MKVYLLVQVNMSSYYHNAPILLELFFDQDSANCNGGKWIIRFKKAISGRFWEDLVRKNQLVVFFEIVYSNILGIFSIA